jgi:hypothetical protein
MSQRVAFCSRLFPGIFGHLQGLSATPCNMFATSGRSNKHPQCWSETAESRHDCRPNRALKRRAFAAATDAASADAQLVT